MRSISNLCSASIMLVAFITLLLVLVATFVYSKDFTFGFPASKHGAPLVAAGIRRAFFLDVHYAGIYMSNDLMASKKAAIKMPADLALLAEGSGSFFGPDATLALKFRRAVSGAQLVGALKASLAASVKDKKALDSLAAIVSKGVGAGVKADDAIDYVFNGDKLDVVVNRKVVGTVHSKEIKKAVLMAYIGEHSVAPEINFALKERFLSKK